MVGDDSTRMPAGDPPPWESFLPGSRRDARGRFVRFVDRLVLHGGYLRGTDLLDQLVSERTRYLVLDLDRTFHLGANMGELLGWEARAFSAYGGQYVRDLADEERRGRLLLAWERPLGLLRYLYTGARRWAYPGLLYLFSIKLGMKWGGTRPWIYRLLGPQPVEVAQEIARVALMHHLTELPLDLLRELAERVWLRHAGDQVFFAEDFAALKRRYPRLKVVISSASPQPVLEVAQAELGVDEILYSAIEEHEGYLTAPHLTSRLLMLADPERIAPPSTLVQNAGAAKVRNLLERFPDFLDDDVETVGVTDTSRGEDRAWTAVFDRLADVNSPTPYSPLVVSTSPLREVHSARLLTRDEDERLRQGEFPQREDDGQHVDTPAQTVFDRATLEVRLGPQRQQLEQLAAAYREVSAALAEPRARLQRLLDDAERRMELAVRDYNRWVGPRRELARARLWQQLRARRQLRAEERRLVRELSQLRRRIDRLQRASRAALAEGLAPSGVSRPSAGFDESDTDDR
jgi:hypothetical protein